MSIRLETAEQQELVLQNMGLVYFICKKLGIAPYNFEDAASIGTLGLIKAAATFDSSKEANFCTYAITCIRNEIFMAFRKTKTYQYNCYLSDPLHGDADNENLTLGDTLIDPPTEILETIIVKDLFVKFISIVLNILDSREKLTVLYKLAGNTQKTIGANLGLSQAYISRFQKKAIKKLQDYLYSTNSVYYEEVFKVSESKDLYEITFSTTDIQKFSMIFSDILSKIFSEKALPIFQLVYKRGKVTLKIPAYQDSFSIIAQLVKEIEMYNLKLDVSPNFLR